MEGSIYSSLGLKMNRTFREKKESELFTMKDLLENKIVVHNENELKRIFVKDLKAILSKEDLFDLIHGFFELETDLNNAYDRLDFESSLVNFDEFYKNLSPVLMRALLENVSHPDNAVLILKSIKEALRIALEEELVQLEDMENHL